MTQTLFNSLARNRRSRAGNRVEEAREVGGSWMEPETQYLVKLEKLEDKSEKKRKKKEKKYELVRYGELPEYMKENEYILGYYRAEWPLGRAALSLFSWHNETINIWTHLIGFLVFLQLTLVHLGDVPEVADLLGHFIWPFPSNGVKNVSLNQGNFLSAAASETSTSPEISSNSSPKATQWPFFVFMAGSMFCLLTSSTFHLFSCHSHRLSLFLARFDYVGIAIMIVSSFYPPIYYIFQCEPHWQFIYLGTITGMGIVTAITLLSPHLTTGACRSYRALLFSAMGLLGIVPAVHASIINWSSPERPITLAYESAMALFYLTGTLFYVSRIPERWKPGMFDLTGHSHQIFHVFVVAGALAHYAVALIFLNYRNLVGCHGKL